MINASYNFQAKPLKNRRNYNNNYEDDNKINRCSPVSSTRSLKSTINLIIIRFRNAGKKGLRKRRILVVGIGRIWKSRSLYPWRKREVKIARMKNSSHCKNISHPDNARPTDYQNQPASALPQSQPLPYQSPS